MNSYLLPLSSNLTQLPEIRFPGTVFRSRFRRRKPDCGTALGGDRHRRAINVCVG